MAKRVRTNKTEIDDLMDVPVKSHKNELHESAWYEEMRAGILIDKNDLDEEFVRQGDLMFRVSEKIALTQSLRDQAKSNLKIIEAEVDEEIRAVSIRTNIKITEGGITAKIRQHRDVQTGQRELAQYERELGLLEALRTGFSQRSSMLRGLSDLYTSNYFERNSGGTETKASKDRQYDGNRRGLHRERERRRSE